MVSLEYLLPSAHKDLADLADVHEVFKIGGRCHVPMHKGPPPNFPYATVLWSNLNFLCVISYEIYISYTFSLEDRAKFPTNPKFGCIL